MNEKSNWMPCTFEFARHVGMVEGNPFGVMVTNPSDGPLAFAAPLPTVRRNNRLHLSGVSIGLFKADGANGITKIQLRGITHDGNQVLWDDANHYSGTRRVEHTFGPIDCSAYDVIKVIVYVSYKGQEPLAISFVNVKYEYV